MRYMRPSQESARKWARSLNGHTRLRLAVVVLFVVGFPFTQLGERVINTLVPRDLIGATNRCAELEVAMYQAIDDYKYGDRDRWPAARRQVEERYSQMSCEFSTYSMYTLGDRL